MSKSARSAKAPLALGLFVALYLAATAFAGWWFWSALKDVRLQLSADLHGLTVDIIRTLEMTGRYFPELADYLETPDAAVPARIFQRIDILQSRDGVLRSPVERMTLDPSFEDFFFTEVKNYIQALDEIEQRLKAGPLDQDGVYAVEDLMFAAEDAISLIYTESQTYIQGRATLQRNVLSTVSLLLVGLVVALLVALGGLVLVLRKLRDHRRMLQEQAITDPLTGLFNRRHLNDVGEPLFASAKRGGKPLSLIALDVDHFKAFNDTYGHGEGDVVLASVARTLRETTPRIDDLAFRIGGEEFCCLVTTDKSTDAADLAERMRAAVEALAISHEGHPLGHVTASFGLAHATDCADLSNLLKRADEALYRAKESGRNRVAVA